MKPDNILLEEGSARALVTDFGIAQVSAGPGITGRDEVLGTAEFMSPEQASGEAVDERSDIYSLGTVGYYMLTARFLFEGETVRAARFRSRSGCLAPRLPRCCCGSRASCCGRAMATASWLVGMPLAAVRGGRRPGVTDKG